MSLDKPIRMQLYDFHKSYFLVELLTTHPNTFDITVPTTNFGTRLLCSIVDNVEALIDEWFPGLRDIDVINGTQLVTPLSLCPFCSVKPPHCFALRDLIQDALTTDKVHCPKHNGLVDLEILAPDTVVSDLDPKYKVAPGEFVLDESTKNIIGKGGFGEVYKATFRNQTVAVKVFTQKVASINNTTPNHLIRQEVQILSQLQHPFIISLVAVCMRPKAMLLLEFAELGSLSSFDPYSNLSLPLKHRIAVQVASALAFLHKNKVIYRDLKPGNVLIFSLSLLSKVNAKLSDYGIACYATESGLTQPMGTAGCKAPELLAANTSYMSYNDKVDIYSFGLLLFVMMTNGHKPFEELAAGFEIDKFIMEGRPINDIEHYGCPPWPDMQDLINHCLQYNPNDRPTAQQVFDRLCTTEFVSLKRTIQVECDYDTESLFTTRFSRQDGVKHIEVWIVSAVGSQGLLSIMNLSQLNATPQGTALEEGVMILSMVAMDSTYVLMGTNTGTIMVFDGYSHKMKHKLSSLYSPVLCLLYIKTREGSAYICAGLANGKMAIYSHYSMGSPNVNPDKIVDIGKGPVKGMKRFHSRLYICCGIEVVVMEVAKDMTVTRRWKALDNFSSSYLTYIDVGHDSIWTACSKSSAVHIWDIDDGALKGTLRCDEFINDLLQLPKEKRLTPLQARVTSLLLQQHPSSTLWLGLGSGHLLLVNATTRIPLMVVKRQVSAVRGLLSVRALVGEKPAHLILSGGFGFQQRPITSSQANGDLTRHNSSDLLVWDSIMPKMKKTYDDIRKQLEPYMNKEVAKL